MGIYEIILQPSSVLPLAIHLPHHRYMEQTFYTNQGKGSRRVNGKPYFPVKPFRQRTDEQDRSRKKSDQTAQDKFVKTAGKSPHYGASAKMHVPAAWFLQIYLR